jgi:hypothetical protein
MPYKSVVGDDGELLVEVAAPARKRRPLLWLLLAVVIVGGLVFVSEWSKGPGEVLPAFYRARLAEIGGAENGSCAGWNLWGVVDRSQPNMTVRALDAEGRIYEGRVHSDIQYQLILSPQAEPLQLSVVLSGADGQAFSEPFEVRFASDQCNVRLDFDGVD